MWSHLLCLHLIASSSYPTSQPTQIACNLLMSNHIGPLGIYLCGCLWLEHPSQHHTLESLGKTAHALPRLSSSVTFSMTPILSPHGLCEVSFPLPLTKWRWSFLSARCSQGRFSLQHPHMFLHCFILMSVSLSRLGAPWGQTLSLV